MSQDTPLFAELTSPEAGRFLAVQPVLLLPVGAIEPHGPHAPLGTDPLISQGICERAARRRPGRALVLPALPYGVTKYAAAFPGAIHINEDTLHALLVDVLTSVLDQGFRQVVLVNNHFEPAQVATMRRVVGTIRADRGVEIGHLDLVRRRNAARLTPEFRSGSCHAGRYETSLVLADRPDLVHDHAGLPELPVDMPAAMAAGKADFLAMGMNQAYCGAPAEATAEEGEQTFETLTDLLLELVDSMTG